jgi:ankyrin repeat protein
VRVLLELGADLNKQGRRDGHDVCAMGMAAEDFALVEMLVSRGVDVNVLHYDDQGNSYHAPLHFAASAQWAQLLLDAGANLETLDQDKNTALCLTRNFDVARTLLKAGANPNARNVYGRTPLHHARSVEWVKLLVAAGADGKKCVDVNGRTPVMAVVAEPDLVRAMVEIAGVDVSARDYQNQSVLAVNNYAYHVGVCNCWWSWAQTLTRRLCCRTNARNT